MEQDSLPPDSPAVFNDNDDTESSSSDEEEHDYPELLFVPLQSSPATVPASAFVVYIVTLGIFCYLIFSQHIYEDFQVNQGLRQGVAGSLFVKLSTIDDYQRWWPQLMDGLGTWQAASDGAVAVLVGTPQILQWRQMISNDGHAADDAGATTPVSSVTANIKPVQLVGAYNNSGYCYISTSGSHYDLADTVNVSEVIRGNKLWKPSEWLDPHTSRIEHRFMVYVTGAFCLKATT
jgi:hypothetical protein